MKRIWTTAFLISTLMLLGCGDEDQRFQTPPENSAPEPSEAEVTFRLINENAGAPPLLLKVPATYLRGQRPARNDGEAITVDGNVQILFRLDDMSPVPEGTHPGTDDVLWASLELGTHNGVSSAFHPKQDAWLTPSGETEYRLDVYIREVQELRYKFWYSDGGEDPSDAIRIQCTDYPKNKNCSVLLQNGEYLTVFVQGFPRDRIAEWPELQAGLKQLIDGFRI